MGIFNILEIVYITFYSLLLSEFYSFAKIRQKLDFFYYIPKKIIYFQFVFFNFQGNMKTEKFEIIFSKLNMR